MEKVREHQHPQNQEQRIHGRLLQPGEVPVYGDKYDCRLTGQWQDVPSSLFRPIQRGGTVVFVRPIPRLMVAPKK